MRVLGVVHVETVKAWDTAVLVVSSVEATCILICVSSVKTCHNTKVFDRGSRWSEKETGGIWCNNVCALHRGWGIPLLPMQ